MKHLVILLLVSQLVSQFGIIKFFSFFRKYLMHEFEFRSYLGLSCRDEFLNRDSLFQLPQVDEFSLFTDFALDPHESSCQN